MEELGMKCLLALSIPISVGYLFAWSARREAEWFLGQIGSNELRHRQQLIRYKWLERLIAQLAIAGLVALIWLASAFELGGGAVAVVLLLAMFSLKILWDIRRMDRKAPDGGYYTCPSCKRYLNGNPCLRERCRDEFPKHRACGEIPHG